MMMIDCVENRLLTSRRGLLLGGASFAAWAYLPKFARAADGRDPRLIVVILRGALDGLSTVAPVGDPDYAGLHGSIALTRDGPHAAVMLDSFFALHPAMPEFARMYRDKHAAILHAVSTPYRDRSHFDGQDVLESGFAGPGRVQSGWLNRALEVLPRGERVMRGLAVGPTTPTISLVSNSGTLVTSAVGRNAAPSPTTVVVKPTTPAARAATCAPAALASDRKR